MTSDGAAMSLMEFTSKDRFEIKTRGSVFVIKLPYQIQRDEVKRWIGSECVIDGNRYTIKGIETYLTHMVRDLGILV